MKIIESKEFIHSGRRTRACRSRVHRQFLRSASSKHRACVLLCLGAPFATVIHYDTGRALNIVLLHRRESTPASPRRVYNGDDDVVDTRTLAASLARCPRRQRSSPRTRPASSCRPLPPSPPRLRLRQCAGKCGRAPRASLLAHALTHSFTRGLLDKLGLAVDVSVRVFACRQTRLRRRRECICARRVSQERKTGSAVGVTFGDKKWTFRGRAPERAAWYVPSGP